MSFIVVYFHNLTQHLPGECNISCPWTYHKTHDKKYHKKITFCIIKTVILWNWLTLNVMYLCSHQCVAQIWVIFLFSCSGWFSSDGYMLQYFLIIFSIAICYAMCAWMIFGLFIIKTVTNSTSQCNQEGLYISINKNYSARSFLCHILSFAFKSWAKEWCNNEILLKTTLRFMQVKNSEASGLHVLCFLKLSCMKQNSIKRNAPLILSTQLFTPNWPQLQSRKSDRWVHCGMDRFSDGSLLPQCILRNVCIHHL